MKNLLLTILVFSLWSGLLFSQTKIWEKSTGINFSIILSMNRIDNDSFIISGGIASSIPTFINFNSQGDELWQKDIVARSLIPAYGKDQLITVDSSQSVWLLDYSGNLIKTISLPKVKVSGLYVYYIDKTENRYYMTALALSGDKEAVFIYDQNFSFIRSFPVMDNSLGWVISTATEDGNIYLARYKYGQGVTSNMISEVFKYDSLGNLIWKKELLDRSDAYIVMNGGQLYLAATNLWAYQTNLINWEIIKLDPTNGNTIWTRHYLGHDENDRDDLWLKGLTSLPGGGVVALGITNKAGKHGIYNPLAMAYSADGDSLWSIELTESNSAGEFDVAAWSQYNALMLGGSVDWSSKIWKYSIPGLTAVKEENSEIPSKFSLAQNYPNPFNPTTTIKFSVTKSSFVTLKIYDLLGREVAILVNKELDFGTYNTKFNAENLTSGIYIYRITIGRDFASSKKMMLLK